VNIKLGAKLCVDLQTILLSPQDYRIPTCKHSFLTFEHLFCIFAYCEVCLEGPFSERALERACSSHESGHFFNGLGESFGTDVRAEQKFVARIVQEACFTLAYIILPLLWAQHCSLNSTPKLSVLPTTGRDYS